MRSLILLFVASTRTLEMPYLAAATMAPKCRLIFNRSSRKAGIRHARFWQDRQQATWHLFPHGTGRPTWCIPMKNAMRSIRSDCRSSSRHIRCFKPCARLREMAAEAGLLSLHKKVQLECQNVKTFSFQLTSYT